MIEENAQKDTQKVIIEVTRYKAFLEALGDSRKVFRIILIISAITVLVFSGITLVLLSVKRIYPYSDITTNVFGATTIKNEKSEVSYWLFNTAELWANSGIKVKQGQTIKIRASGKKHTAIHHLVKDVDSNRVILTDPWVGTEGFSEQRSVNKERDAARARYRIFPEQNQDALLVQVVPSRWAKKDLCQLRTLEGGNQIELVGKGKKIRIEEDGTLYFAINDIVLDDETVIGMMAEMKGEQLSPQQIKDKANAIEECRKTYCNDPDKAYDDFLEKFNLSRDSVSRVNDKKFMFGLNEGTDWIEIFGYCMNEYRTPWFDDNIGSFLILVETVTE